MPAYEIVDAPSQHEDRAGWLAARRKGIGSSDAPAVCGLSPWSTPLGVYADKVWGVEEERSEHLDIGTMIEPLIASMYEQKVGAKLVELPMIRSLERPWQTANIDRVRWQINLDGRVVEIKNYGSSQGWGSEGTDDVPAHVFIQVQHQLDVHGSHIADLAALLGGTSFRVYEIRRDEQIIARMREIEEQFWEGCVLAQVAPPPDFAHASTADLMKRLNAPTSDDCIPLTQIEAEWAEQYKAIGEQMSDLKKQQESLRSQIEHAIGPYASASLPNGMIVRRKTVSRKAYSVDATSYVSFTISKGK